MRQAQDDDLVMSLVDRALSQEPEEREAYVRGACASDAELFDQVWDYVQSEGRMNGFLQHPISDDFQLSAPDSVSSDHEFQTGELPAGPFLIARQVAGLDGEHPLEAGQVLEDRFHIVREVGYGGMGVVYEALDVRLGRHIAIKCARAGFRQRLSPEVRHASEISHPNVCKMYEIHTADTSRGEIDFITMEFIEGQTLGERLRKGPVPKDEAEIIANQLCAGLAEAHLQVIHGDLKSNNVLLGRPILTYHPFPRK
jgi:hypothetical protein